MCEWENLNTDMTFPFLNCAIVLPNNEVFARKEEQKDIGQLELNKPCRLRHLMWVSNIYID